MRLSVNLNSSVSCLMNLQIQYVSHLLSDDAGRGARVEEHIDGAGVGTACQDGTLMDIYSVYFHNGVTGDLGETGVGWGCDRDNVCGLVIFSFIIVIILVTFSV